LMLYRPYLPAHLLQRNTEAVESGDHTPRDPQRSRHRPERNSVDSHSTTKSVPDVPVTRVSDSESTCNSDSLPQLKNISVIPARETRLRPSAKPLGSLEVPQSRKQGTLLYVKLHGLESYADNSGDPQCVANVARTSNIFVEAVLAAVNQMGGLVHNMQHGACTVTWNFFAAESMHAQNACLAAVRIRDTLVQHQAAYPHLPLAPSMGIWAGRLICGSVGNKDYKAPSMLGPGLSHAVKLQRYAADSGRAIVANAEVHKDIAAAPRSRLLPIDIVQFQCARPRYGHELEGTQRRVVYEVVDNVIHVDDEWMYALQHTANEAQLDTRVAALLLQVQVGVEDNDEFVARLHTLRQCGDKAVQAVCRELEALLGAGHLDRPFCRASVDQWVPDFISPSCSVIRSI
jgi:hypothetical protein